MPQVAPYSGAMLAMVARSASDSVATPGAEELDELADDARLAQDLGHRQHQVGRGRSLAQLAVQPEADHLRDQHRQRLAQHRRLGLDAADAPAQHAQAVDHRRVRVGADQRVGIRLRGAGLGFGREHDARQVLQVHLVDDAGVGRHHREVAERGLSPAQERVALLVARELDLRVQRQRLGRCRTRRPAPSDRSPARRAAAG